MRLECFVCGADLDQVEGPLGPQPSKGTIWRSRGNYGSTVLDANGAAMLFVCDKCLRERQGRLISWQGLHVEEIYVFLPGLVFADDERWLPEKRQAQKMLGTALLENAEEEER